MKEFGSLFYNAAIMDFGSATIKADFAGEEIPSVQFSSLIGKPKYSKIFSANQEEDIIGPDVSIRGLYRLHYPIRRGVFINANESAKIIEKVFKDLQVKDTSSISVLVTQPVVLPKNNKKSLAETFFESNGTNNSITSIGLEADGNYSSNQPQNFRDFFFKEEMSLLGF